MNTYSNCQYLKKENKMKVLIIDNESDNTRKTCEQLVKIKGPDLSEENIYIYQPNEEVKGLKIVSFKSVKGSAINDCNYMNYKPQVMQSMMDFIKNADGNVIVLIDLVLNTIARSDYPKKEYYEMNEYSVELFAEVLEYRLLNQERAKHVFGIMYSSSETGDITIAQVLKDIYNEKVKNGKEPFPPQAYQIENITFFTRSNDKSVDVGEDSPIRFEEETI